MTTYPIPIYSTEEDNDEYDLTELENDEIQRKSTMTTTKPLYLLIKLDVDGEVVFTYDEAAKYAQNFCNSLEFELIDHCLEEKENPCLYIGGEEDNK